MFLLVPAHRLGCPGQNPESCKMVLAAAAAAAAAAPAAAAAAAAAAASRITFISCYVVGECQLQSWQPVEGNVSHVISPDWAEQSPF